MLDVNVVGHPHPHPFTSQKTKTHPSSLNSDARQKKIVLYHKS
jgi:hypothetical protein